MIAVTYQIQTEEPLLATSLEGEPNSAVSFNYIPGSLIRGLVASVLASGGSDIAKTERDLIFNGTTRFLNAYPVLVDESERRLPAPLSWKIKKLEANNPDALTYDFALLDDKAIREKGQTKDWGGRFTAGQASVRTRHAPKRHISIHTLRNRDAGRATQVLGAVYRYDAIAQGEWFAGAMIAPDMEQAEKIKKWLSSGTYFLGGAQGGGYGKVNISKVDIDSGWSEYPNEVADIPAGQPFRITLLSDTILRTVDGVPTLQLTRLGDFELTVKNSYLQSTYVGGFNRKWGLPLPQEQAIQAGSVFILQSDQAISATELQSFMESGIGERRAEGFGRFAINWGNTDSFKFPRANKPKPKQDGPPETSNTIELDADSANIAKRMQERRLRQQMDQALVNVISSHKVRGNISATQLARLRIIARSALAEFLMNEESTNESPKGPKRLHVLFNDKQKGLRATALQKYRRVRVNNQPIPTWISSLVDTITADPEHIGQVLKMEKPVPLDPDNPAQPIDAAAAFEYMVRLIDGVLSAKMKERT